MTRQVWLAFGSDSKSPSAAWGHFSKGLATGVRGGVDSGEGQRP
jgi:hypothetical protein